MEELHIHGWLSFKGPIDLFHKSHSLNQNIIRKICNRPPLAGLSVLLSNKLVNHLSIDSCNISKSHMLPWASHTYQVGRTTKYAHMVTASKTCYFWHLSAHMSLLIAAENREHYLCSALASLL